MPPDTSSESVGGTGFLDRLGCASLPLTADSVLTLDHSGERHTRRRRRLDRRRGTQSSDRRVLETGLDPS